MTGTAVFKLHPDWELSEYECTNERMVTDSQGNQVVTPAAKP